MATRIEKIRIRNIAVIAENHRPLCDQSVKLIADSMRVIGLRSPITVHKGWDGYYLVAGRLRLEAAKSLGWRFIECDVIEAAEAERRLWNRAENAHRAELTALQRAEHTAEWDQLARLRRKAAQAAQPGGRQPSDRGISKGARDLGISRDELSRARSIASVSPAAKAKAIELKLDRKQSALLEIAREKTEEAQVAKADEIASRKRKARTQGKEATDRGPEWQKKPNLAADRQQGAKRSASVSATLPLRDASSPPQSEKPSFEDLSRSTLSGAVLQIGHLASQGPEKFVDVVPPGLLVTAIGFLQSILESSTKSPEIGTPGQ